MYTVLACSITTTSIYQDKWNGKQNLLNGEFTNMIKEIEQELRIGQINPHRLAEIRSQLSAEYSYMAGILEEILATKAVKWLTMRQDQKSDKSTDLHWDALPEGIQEMRCRMELKRCEKLIGGIKSLLDVAEGQARNKY